MSPYKMHLRSNKDGNHSTQSPVKRPSTSRSKNACNKVKSPVKVQTRNSLNKTSKTATTPDSKLSSKRSCLSQSSIEENQKSDKLTSNFDDSLKSSSFPFQRTSKRLSLKKNPSFETPKRLPQQPDSVAKTSVRSNSSISVETSSNVTPVAVHPSSKNSPSTHKSRSMTRFSKRISTRKSTSEIVSSTRDHFAPSPQRETPEIGNCPSISSRRTSKECITMPQIRKQPVWAKEKGSPSWVNLAKRASRRLSRKKNEDVYELDFETEGVKVKKKVYRKKKPKISKREFLKTGHTSTMLTTDPQFENKFKFSREVPNVDSRDLPDEDSNDLPDEDSRDLPDEDSNDLPDENSNDLPDEDSNDLPYEDSRDLPDAEDSLESLPPPPTLDNCSIDDGYDASISVQNETESSFMIPNNTFPIPKSQQPLYHGTTSTPFHESNFKSISHFDKGANMGDEVQLCFGFDEPESDAQLNMSPVKKVNTLLGKSNAFLSYVGSDGVYEFDPCPTRFGLSVGAPLKQMQNIPKRTTTKSILKKNKSILPKNKHAPSDDLGHNSLERRNTHDYTIFSDVLDDEEIDTNKCKNIGESQNKQPEQILRSPIKTASASHEHILQLEESPLKSFMKKAPSRSYCRSSLDLSSSFRDFANENQGPSKLARKGGRGRERKKKTQHSDAIKKGKNRQKTIKRSASHSSSNEESRSIEQRPKNPGKKKKINKEENNWVSKMNSDFSEVDEFALVIE